MSTILDSASLRNVGLYESTNIYSLESKGLQNRYFVLSGPGSRKLLSSPETVGFPCYSALLDETIAALRHLFPSGKSGDIDILTILRGGLNYPLEEAASKVGIRVRDMHFVSCERIIKDHVITGLEIKYDQIRPTKDRIIAIGDIIASGETLRHCIKHVADAFHKGGGSIRKVIFFTIGGSKAITLMEKLTEEFRLLFPGFEGFECFFIEGIFTVYEDKGVSGINVPDIDFGWNSGAVSPEFRSFIADHPDAIYEKCIIYDGGARRYNIPDHFDEVLEYWKGINDRADIIDAVALRDEKLGYKWPVSFDTWRQITHLQELPEEVTIPLWEKEQRVFAAVPDLGSLAERRINSINLIKKQYENE